ncbi:MAG: PadR family transcriptional regulator [Paenibacillaceae bacterium]|nr:PadR family transcriptional regulator [Paenibacillaceae bacterium]
MRDGNTERGGLPELNTLAYGLLALLSKERLSGYDMMLRIQPFWQAKHSQIYPLLAKLERLEYVRYNVYRQDDKPDKKIYAITDAGIDAIRVWIAAPTAEPASRDELLLKTYCIRLSDAPTMIRMFAERERLYRDKLALYEKMAGELREDKSESYLAHTSDQFGKFILLQKAIAVVRTNIEWCVWVRKLLGDETAGET